MSVGGRGGSVTGESTLTISAVYSQNKRFGSDLPALLWRQARCTSIVVKRAVEDGSTADNRRLFTADAVAKTGLTRS